MPKHIQDQEQLDCCVCYESKETWADTPCKHSKDPVCELCYLKVISKAYHERQIATCPLCRARWEPNGIEPESEPESEPRLSFFYHT